ncbi:hypothetical protein D3C81_1121700 [compost metagenome]
MAHAAVGVLRLGDRDAAHVPHDLHRKPQPALAGQRELGSAAVPAADEPGGAADSLGRAETRRHDQPGIFHAGHRHRGQQQGFGAAGVRRRIVRCQWPDHRHHPGAVRHGTQPFGVAALSASGGRQHLPLAEMDTPGADRRDHHGRLWFLPVAGRRAGPGQPRHRRVCGHAAIPAGRAVGSILADRQPPRLHRRFAGGDSGVAGDHAAAAGRQPAGLLYTVVEHDLRARRHQLAHGRDRLAGRQRTDVHPDLAVHQRQHRRGQRRRSLRRG